MTELLKFTNINNYNIDLVENKQIFSGSIYNLSDTRNSKDLHQDLANRIIQLSFS